MDSNKTLRDQLKGVRSAISETREERAELRKARDEAKEAFAGADLSDPKVVQSDEFKQAEQAVGAVGAVEDKLADLQQTEVTILGLLGEDVPDPGSNGGSPAGADGRSRVASLLEGEAFQRLKSSGSISSRSKLGAVSLGALCDREETKALLQSGILAASGSGDELVIGSEEKQGAIPADRRGIVPALERRLTLLDLLPVGETDSNVVEYVQELAPVDDGPAVVPEGEKKPQLALETRDAEAPVRTIAGFHKIKKQALEDVAGLGSLISRRLPYRVRDKVEREIIAGDGVDDRLLGLLNTEEIGAPEAVEGDNTADAILRAATVVELSDGNANFVGLHPLTKQELQLMRENQAERTGQYLYGSPAVVQAPTIWGLLMVSNRVIPAATPLVGDSMEAEILVRAALNVLISDNDGDDFTRNRVTVLAETRVAFPVWRPSSFALAPVPVSGSGSGV